MHIVASTLLYARARRSEIPVLVLDCDPLVPLTHPVFGGIHQLGAVP